MEVPIQISWCCCSVVEGSQKCFGVLDDLGLLHHIGRIGLELDKIVQQCPGLLLLVGKVLQKGIGEIEPGQRGIGCQLDGAPQLADSRLSIYPAGEDRQLGCLGVKPPEDAMSPASSISSSISMTTSEKFRIFLATPSLAAAILPR